MLAPLVSRSRSAGWLGLVEGPGALWLQPLGDFCAQGYVAGLRVGVDKRGVLLGLSAHALEGRPDFLPSSIP
eukprot:8437929-Alexandrium_andersonii.AAC.1